MPPDHLPVSDVPSAALFETIAARIRRQGPLSFAVVVQLALYDPVLGFYASGGHAGRRGDFITSPEVGPLFGAVMGAYLDEVWHELGQPDPFVVVEAGAGIGTLARSVREGAPACLPALTYVLVEQSPALRARHGDHLDISDPVLAFPPARADDDGPGGGADGDVSFVARDQARGPRFVSLAELPAVSIRGVVFANELLDNLAFDILERTSDGWGEVRVALADDERSLVERVVPAAAQDTAWADSFVPQAVPGARIPVQHTARDWVSDALGRVIEGRLLLIDYGTDTAALARRGVAGWLRTYRGQQRGAPPLADLGLQDITTDVAFDQVARQHAPTRVLAQAEFLRYYGMDTLVEEGRRVWSERGGVGDLASLKARSRVREAEALTDPAGLGAFTVVEWCRR